MCSKTVGISFVVAALIGCAAPAPQLPRYVQQSTEPGYSTPPQATVDAAPLGKKLAVITRGSWLGLTETEHSKITGLFETKIFEDDQFGIVTDVQGADQSSAGTNTGAVLGGAVANATYVDQALRGGNYSATSQLAAGILGAALGSSMDTRPSTQFQFRYTVKLGDGDIKYFDEVKSTSFRHSVGVCLALPSLTLLSQQVCSQTPDIVRKRFLN